MNTILITNILYEYPSRPNKTPSRKVSIYDGLVTPLIPQSSLTIDDVAIIFDYYKPTPLPDFDSYKSSSISTEMAAFLTKLVTVMFGHKIEECCIITKNEDVLKKWKDDMRRAWVK